MKNTLLSLTLLAALPMSAAPGAKIAPDLRTPDNREVDVIVQFSAVPSEQNHLRIAARGGKLKARFGQMRAAAYTIRGSAVDDIAALPEVSYVSADRPLRGQLDYSRSAIHSDIAWRYGWTGKGIGIAILDSGVSESADLRRSGSSLSRVVYSESFVGHDTQVHYGHGTHVAGIAAGNGSDSEGRYQGIAPKANLINLRVLDDMGTGWDSSVIAAIARAIEIKDRYGIRVMNLSLGRPVSESYSQDPLCQAVEAAWKAGIVVVVAAGNDGRDNSAGNHGYGTIMAPGNDPYVITVGAMKAMNTYAHDDDLIASYSSKGPTAIDHIVKPDLVAPGNQVVSVMGIAPKFLAREYPQNIVKEHYFQLSGTSMAAPMVSAAAALLLEQNPSLTPDQIKARLMKTASKRFPAVSIATDPQTGDAYTSYYDFFTVGAGYLDVMAALDNADLAHESARSPVAGRDPETGNVFLVPDDSIIWGANPAWEVPQIWGAGASWGAAGVGATSVIWGSGTVDGLSVVWGSSTFGDASGVNGVASSILGEK